MKCPHCTTNFHDEWWETPITHGSANKGNIPFIVPKGTWHYRTTVCSDCKNGIIEIAPFAKSGEMRLRNWRMVYPIGASRGPVSPEVPIEITEDYIEACSVLPISTKASAALSRRCLQNILHSKGYKAGSGDLGKEIDLLLNEADPKKVIPQSLHDTIDAIRNFGNFSAHRITDKTTLQIIEVEDHEAEWCLEILEECFEYFYVKPAAAKARKLALDAKLAAAKKPPSK